MVLAPMNVSESGWGILFEKVRQHICAEHRFGDMESRYEASDSCNESLGCARMRHDSPNTTATVFPSTCQTKKSTWGILWIG